MFHLVILLLLSLFPRICWLCLPVPVLHVSLRTLLFLIVIFLVAVPVCVVTLLCVILVIVVSGSPFSYLILMVSTPRIPIRFFMGCPFRVFGTTYRVYFALIPWSFSLLDLLGMLLITVAPLLTAVSRVHSTLPFLGRWCRSTCSLHSVSCATLCSFCLGC